MLESPKEGEGIQPVYIGDRVRYGSVTSVQFLADDLLACGSFDGRRLDLVGVDQDGGLRLLDSLSGTFEGVPVQNDLLGASPSKEFFATTNFFQGSSTLYRHDGQKISLVRDFPVRINGFVHGIRFLTDDIFALTACTGPMGVHFFDVQSGKPFFAVKIPRKCQDIVFLSENRMLVIAVTGHPRFATSPIYDSEITEVEFDLEKKTSSIVGVHVFKKAHYDAGAVWGGNVYITDQYNNQVVIFNATTLERVGALDGFSFPHGLDIRNGHLAVTNYGTSMLTLQRLEPVCEPAMAQAR